MVGRTQLSRSPHHGKTGFCPALQPKPHTCSNLLSSNADSIWSIRPQPKFRHGAMGAPTPEGIDARAGGWRAVTGVAGGERRTHANLLEIRVPVGRRFVSAHHGVAHRSRL